MARGFVWDPAKAAANVRKHGVTFEEAVTVFIDPLARIHDDPEHSRNEDREIIVGHTLRRHLIVVSFTQRGRIVRLISARQATRNERQDYEKGTQT